MARALDAWEVAQERKRKAEELKATRKARTDFVKKFVSATDEGKAKMIFDALSEKSDKGHYHTRETV